MSMYSRRIQISTIYLILVFHGEIFSQSSDSTAYKVKGKTARFFWGGSFGFSNQENLELDLAPVIGYQPLGFMDIGLGLVGHYQSNKTENNSAWNVGARLYTQLQPGEKWPFLHVEYEFRQNIQNQDNRLDSLNTSIIHNTNKEDHTWNLSKYGQGSVGIGFPINLTANTKVSILALRNIEEQGNWLDESTWQLRAGMTTAMGRKRKAYGFNQKGERKKLFVRDTTRVGDKPLSERLVIGGNANANMPSKPNKILSNGSEHSQDSIIGNNNQMKAAFDFSFHVMYEAFKDVHVGLGPSLQYSQSPENDKGTVGFGMKAFVRYKPIQSLPYLQLEYDGKEGKADSLNYSGKKKSWVSSALMGAGYTIPLGGNGGIDFTLMRNLTWKDATPVNPSPWSFRIGYTGGLPSRMIDGGGMGQMGNISQLLMIPLQELMGKAGIEGNMSMSIGKPTKVDLSPTLNIPIDSIFSIGVGVSYRFEQDSLDLDHRNNEQFGGRIYFRYAPKPKWPYLQAEYEGYQSNIDSFSVDELGKGWYSALLLGTGYNIPLTKKKSFGVMVFRNLTYRGVTPVHNSPWVIRTSLSGNLIKPKTKGDPRKSPPPVIDESFSLSDWFKVEGNVSLSLGTTTSIDVSPLFAYEFTKAWTIGIGPTYQYQKNIKKNVSNSVFGGRAFTRFMPAEGYPYAQAELESLKGQRVSTAPREWYPAVLIGGGVKMPIGKKAAFLISVLRDLSYEPGESLRYEPWVVRVGLQI